MGSAEIQGPLWGARAEDWAAYAEQVGLPLFAAALDAARVTKGTRLLDAGCGAGLLALLGRLRGAEVTAIDAAPGMVEVARRRLPGADVRVGDLESLPFDDASFDAVIGVNSIFYAADMATAMREIARVVRPGGLVVLTAWGPPEKCEFLTAIMPNLGPLMPPPPPGAPPPHPGALSEPGALAAVLQASGLRPKEEGQVDCPFIFPSAEISWLGNASAGVNQAAIAHSGEGPVHAAYTKADADHTRPDGSVRYDNVFLWASGERT
ncbi:MAG: class I SAM-dependent methyltransferase [Croceibacterium sp.]